MGNKHKLGVTKRGAELVSQFSTFLDKIVPLHAEDPAACSGTIFIKRG